MRPQFCSSWFKKPTSNGALWMMISASCTKAMSSSAMASKAGLSLKNAVVRPCTRSAPSSLSRPGLMYRCSWLPVGWRLMSSTQPISMMRLPSLISMPVVSVSRTIWRRAGGGVGAGIAWVCAVMCANAASSRCGWLNGGWGALGRRYPV